jgi:predicted nucleotidyltransferase component of viral defense system
MIPYGAITDWNTDHKWATAEQVEQDLLLSQAICEIANDEFLGDELVFRGGTAFHKLFMPKPYRYSEDLDFVRTTASGIAPVTRHLTEIGKRLGYKVKTKITKYPKVYWQCEAQTGEQLRIKLEMNTYERSPALPFVKKEYKVNTGWYTSQACVKTFQLEELIATKIRALYQRSKGRDLFDMWLALTNLSVNPDAILAPFGPYRPDDFTAEKCIDNLDLKLQDSRYRHDLDNLVVQNVDDYDIDAAADLIKNEILSKL